MSVLAASNPGTFLRRRLLDERAPYKRTQTAVLFLVGVAIVWPIANATMPNGVSLGQVVDGLILGGLNALTAMGLVIIYRSIRVINFVQAALGSVASALAVLLVTGFHISYWYAVPIGVLSAMLAGFLADLFIRWRFARAPRLIVTVVTVGIAQLLGLLSLEMPTWFSGKISPFTTFKTPFHMSFTISQLTFTGDDVLPMVVVPLALVALYWFFVRTDTGVAIRGAAESTERAELLGITVRRLTRITWIVAGALSGFAAILTDPINSSGLGQFTLGLSILAPLAAFVLAGMESLPLAVIWSLVIGVIQQAIFASYGTYTYSQVALFVLICVGLALQRSKQSRGTDAALGEFVAVREVSPLTEVLARRPSIRIGRAGMLLVLLGVAVALPWLTNASVISKSVTATIYGVIAVSMVMLAGWAGQISFGQFAFSGLGGCVAGSLMVHQDVPFLVALLVGGLFGAGLAFLIGLPALRLPGLSLAVVTLAFAVVMSTYVLSSRYFSTLDPSTVAPPHLFGSIVLGPPYTSLYEFGVVLLVLVIGAAVALRRSRTGRAIIAGRDNSRAASAYGISNLKSKLFAFAASGFVAGLAGAIFIVHGGGVAAQSFPATASLGIFIMVVVGGLGSISGAVLGAIYITVVTTELSATWQLLGTGAGVLLVLVLFPEGLGGIVFRIRDWIVALLPSPPEDTVAAAPVTPKPAAEKAADPGTGSHPRSGAIQSAALRFAALEDLELQSQETTNATSVDANPPEGDAALSVKGLNVAYGHSIVLSDVSLGVGAGEIVALLGTNGAGKTTILRTAAGLTRPRKGVVSLFGEDVTGKSAVERVERGLVTVVGGRGIFPSLSVEENLRLAQWTVLKYHKDPAFAASATERVFALFPVLQERKKQRAGLLSGGEQQMLALAQSLLCRPRFIMIDELSLGLAPSVVLNLLGVVRTMSEDGIPVMIVEQSINVATAISKRAVFLERGRVRFSGPTPDLADQPALLRSVFLHAAAKARTKDPDAPEAGGAATGTTKPATDDVLAALTGGVVPATTTASVGAAEPDHLETQTEAARNELLDEIAPSAAYAVVGVSKSFGGIAALTEVSFHVAKGEILGVIGSNGAGKTTLFDVCSGFTKPDSGMVQMGSLDVTAMWAAERARRGLGRVFQDARLWSSMTVREAIATSLERFVDVKSPFAAVVQLPAARRSEREVARKVRELIGEFGLQRSETTEISALSTGTRRIVELACAVAHEPTVLLLDEPTAGISQRETEALAELLLGLRAQTGASFVVIEHDVPLVSGLADRMLCMHLGEVIAEGEPTEVLTNPAVIAAYLGAEEAVVENPA